MRAPRGVLSILGLAGSLAVCACAPNDILVGSNLRPDGGDDGAGGRFGILGTPVGPTTDVQTALPPLPGMTNVAGTIAGDSVKIHFDPVDGARDYRIYVLPADADIEAAGDGHITVHDAIYRCAGDRMAPAPAVDVVTSASNWVRTLVDGQDVDGYTRSLAEATLGHVYPTPAEGRVPVYALGDPAPDADNDCYFDRWAESRSKRYTASESERAQLVAERWRDDGIVFYAPASGGLGIREATSADQKTRYYFADGPEAQARPAGAVAFQALPSAAAGTVPLMRVFYANGCGASHDELSAGLGRFDRAYRQGNQPLWDLRWSGISGPTTLVVEALDARCPWPGVLAPVARPAMTGDGGDYPAWVTLDDARAAAPTGEVFINGQGEATDPRPIARAFLQVSPTSPSGLDWFEGFAPGTALASFSDVDCGATPPNTCWQQFRRTSKDYDTDFISSETERNGFAQVLGELWVGLADVGAGTGGKFRITPQRRAQIRDDAFLYVTLETDTLTTARRFPQLVLSDVAPPIDWTFAEGHSILIQSSPTLTASWPNQLQIQVCDERAWVETAQCPAFADLHHRLGDDASVAGLAPTPEVAEHSGLDRATQWEVYASSARIYLYLDGEPYGCADLPAGAPTGEVSVTFGYVLAHSSIDDMTGLSEFLGAHGQIESHRHLDNLAFQSGVAAPPWDEERLPCARASQMTAGQ